MHVKGDLMLTNSVWYPNGAVDQYYKDTKAANAEENAGGVLLETACTVERTLR